MDHGRPLSNVRQLTVELPGSRSGPGRLAIGALQPVADHVPYGRKCRVARRTLTSGRSQIRT